LNDGSPIQELATAGIEDVKPPDLPPALAQSSQGLPLEIPTEPPHHAPAENIQELRQTTDGQSPEKIASGNDFTTQVEYAPKPDGSGYLFRLTLTPKIDTDFQRISQNVFFLIDRSHSIRSERYEASKAAVAEALAMLQEGDAFNILVFDDQIVRLSSENLPWNKQNVDKAHLFLQEQAYGGSFAMADLYSSLGDIVPSAVSEKEVNIAFLFSDGDAFLSPEKQHDSISHWTQQNGGKISLYSIASGQGNNLALLDLLSAVNKGHLNYVSNDEGLPNLVLKLMQALQNPIGKEITTTSASIDGGAKILLFPSVNRLPNLYQHTPYVIYGGINRLEDFHVFFQGKHYDKWLDIKQKVSFSNAKQSTDRSLEKMWVLQQAYDDYDRYLRSGDQQYLLQARQLLTSYKIPIPF